MAINNVLLLSQLAGYVIALILSLCITVPMSLHQDEFKGHCLLFSTGKWDESNGQFTVKWASQAFCNYIIFVGVILFASSAFQMYRMSRFVYKGTDSTFLSAFFDVIGCLSLCIMTAAAALMVTLGFMTWCDDMLKRFPSCDLAAGNAIDKKDDIDTTGFYIEIGVAQFAVWASWATWVGLSVFSILKLCRYHQLENIRVSMYRERQKLISERAMTSTMESDGRFPDSAGDREAGTGSSYGVQNVI
ncbi:UNVERIFIED_CONTAM: hypothetical protein PYX00_007079 [Menopon gallinae]|uniref:Transmembrane protein 179 n=1 Tax=Menopon gallinae TaxID=328185 RepID=A0AAW2HHQ2_9NEOP